MELPAVGFHKKNPRQPIRKFDKPFLLTVGEDIGFNDIVLTHATTLVGRFNGRNVNAVGVNKWVNDTWEEFVSICPAVYLLLRGWIAFKFC